MNHKILPKIQPAKKFDFAGKIGYTKYRKMEEKGVIYGKDPTYV